MSVSENQPNVLTTTITGYNLHPPRATYWFHSRRSSARWQAPAVTWWQAGVKTSSEPLHTAAALFNMQPTATRHYFDVLLWRRWWHSESIIIVATCVSNNCKQIVQPRWRKYGLPTHCRQLRSRNASEKNILLQKVFWPKLAQNLTLSSQKRCRLFWKFHETVSG